MKYTGRHPFKEENVWRGCTRGCWRGIGGADLVTVEGTTEVSHEVVAGIASDCAVYLFFR